MSVRRDPTPDYFPTPTSPSLSADDFDDYRFDCPECGERVRLLRDHTGGCPVVVDELATHRSD